MGQYRSARSIGEDSSPRAIISTNSDSTQWSTGTEIPGGGASVNPDRNPTAEAFATRLFGAALGTMDLLHIYIGQKLGLYELLAAGDAMNVTSLAEGLE